MPELLRIRRLLAVGATTLAGVACSGGGSAAEAVARETARAEAAAASLTAALVGELTRALGVDGPAHAVRVCGEAAQSITMRNGGEDGFTIRRTALRLRNPVNAPSEWERAVLERWAGEADPQDWSEVATTAGGRELRWMRPIRLMPLCTQCHGAEAEIQPATRDAIRVLYPDDAAIGFAPGDLRGAISVRAPL